MISLGLPAIWGWLGLGLVLIGLEIAAPGSYLLWLGLAALAMAGVHAVFPLTAVNELVLFGALALVFGLIGWKVYRGGSKEDAARDLHNLGGSLIGRELILSQPISDGAGQVRVGDSVWRAIGADMPAGEKVRVIRIEGANLVVEPA